MIGRISEAGKEVAPSGLREESFYIPAMASPSRPRRTLKHGDSFAVVDSHGDIGASEGGPDGIFHRDTRHLSRFELLLNGMPPLLLGSNLRDDNSLLTVDLTNPDIYYDQHLVLPKDTIHIVRALFLWQNRFYHRLGIHNHGEKSINVSISLAFDNDFADIFEVRGMRRNRRGRVAISTERAAGSVSMKYEGLHGKPCGSVLTFDPSPVKLEKNIASYALQLQPGEHCSIFLTLDCEVDSQRNQSNFFYSMIAAARELRHDTSHAAIVVTSNAILNQMLRRAAADVYMLVTSTPQGPYPYAGIPWYSTTFGRDGILTAIEMLWLDPSIAKGVLKRLAAFQATEFDPHNDAEPGKILHEMRQGEMAALREVPFGLYYGSVDSTPLFVLLFGLYVERTGDLETLRELWPNVEAAIAWIDRYGDRDGDGFVEYLRLSEHGLSNQGWKDSSDAVFHEDGRIAEGPITLVEVQGYVYAAKKMAARCARRLKEDVRAKKLDAEADRLINQFDAAFWCETINTYTIALDGNKKPCRVSTSNAGQVLFSGLAKRERAYTVMRSLMEPRFFSGWGIRTVAGDQPRYNPMSYHNGSIWPHDNAMIALGFGRYGFKDAVEQIFGSMLDAAAYMEFQRLPELFCGFRRRRNRGPTLYPVACSPQAWSAAAPFAFLQALLGLEFDLENNEIRLRDPHLPAFIDALSIKRLRLGDASVDLAVHGRGDDLSLRIMRSDGNVQVSAVYR